jgi:hypothetical protein
VWTPVARIVARVRRAREETPESKQKFDTELLVSDVLLKLHTAAVIGLLDDESKTVLTTRLLRADSSGTWASTLAQAVGNVAGHAAPSPPGAAELVTWLGATNRRADRMVQRSPPLEVDPRTPAGDPGADGRKSHAQGQPGRRRRDRGRRGGCLGDVQRRIPRQSADPLVGDLVEGRFLIERESGRGSVAVARARGIRTNSQYVFKRWTNPDRDLAQG